MTAGTDQSERREPSAPAFAVDATRPDERLVMLLRLAQGLRFTREDGVEAGDWGELLQDDETVMLAEVRATDLDRRRRRLLDDFSAGRAHALADHLRELAHWLADWLTRLEDRCQPRAQAMAAAAERMVAQFGASDPLLDDLMSQERAADAILRRLGREPPRPQDLADLRRLYFALLNALDRIRILADAEWRASLTSGQHEPAASLVIALSLVYEQAQARLNTFSDRLRAFYYDDVLRASSKAGRADSVHLILRRDPTHQGPVIIPAGTAFQAARTAQSAQAAFIADTGVRLSDVRVEALRTLRFQRDPLSSAEYHLGLVSRARIDGLDEPGGLPPETEPRILPLLGADARGALPAGDDARLGLAISSPVLWLKEGERAITVRLALDVDPEGLAAAARELAHAPNRTEFMAQLGQVVGRWLLSEDEPLDGLTLTAIGERAVELGLITPVEGVTPSPADVIQRLIDAEGLADSESAPPDERRRLLRNALTENLFTVSVSAPDGWRVIQRPLITSKGQGANLTLQLHLTNEDPPLAACSAEVHGPEWPTQAPTLQLVINDAALIYPVSLLQGVRLDAIDIEVSVDGVRDLRAYNQMGPLDASRPFMPFGPLPDLASYLVVAAPEPAKKRVTRLTIWPEWAGLPADGFAVHYAGYRGGLTDGAFTVGLAVMRDGVWMDAGSAPQPLFVGVPPAEVSPITFDPTALRSLWRPAQGDGDLVLDQTARNGFARIELAGPPAAFGHQAYPGLLTETLSAKVRGRRPPTPNPPYTPMLSRLTLSYTAAAHIDVGSAVPEAAGPVAEQVLHLHPFGAQLIHPTPADERYPVIPVSQMDGNLFIGLGGEAPVGPLTLLFDLRKDAAVEEVARRKPRPRPIWSWLGAGGWQPLEDRRILSDTTSGFLTTGLVTLDLPPGLVSDKPVMPRGLYWLRLASSGPSEAFAGLVGVFAGALRATRAADEPLPDRPLPPHTITLKGQAMPGVIAAEQHEGGFGLRPVESADARRVRIGERLRHKNRASSPWDFERLVLERFPEVQRVRCLPNRTDDSEAPAPGQVLVVVAPAGPRNDPRFSSRALRLDPLELDRIEAYLRERASPAARIKVRNAAYELVQARARMILSAVSDMGDVLQRVNQAIAAHLSPWHDGGCCPGFDWRVRGDDIEDCLRAIPEVQAVNGVSLIHVWNDESRPDGGFYEFEDTADTEADSRDAADVAVSATRPWSLALPAEQHLIEVMREGEEPRAQATGVAAGAGLLGASIAGVALGSTFVVGGSRRTAAPAQPPESEPE